MAGQDSDSNTKVAFWLVGGVVVATLAGTLFHATRQAPPVAAPVAAAAAASDQATAQQATPALADASAAAPASVPADMKLVDQVFFASGQTAVPAESGAAIAAAASAWQQSPQASLVLSGFHDASGAAAVNADVAKRRAVAVRDALAAAGVAADHIRLEKPQLTLDGGDPKLARRVDISLAH